MKLTKIIYRITMISSKKFIIAKYDKEFWENFKCIAKKNLNHIMLSVVDIGHSIFSFQYEFGPCYISWYKAFEELNIPSDEIDKNIWKMNEMMLTIFPKSLIKLIGKHYFNSFRKKSKNHVEKQNNNALHPYDWKVIYREVDKNTFELDITECAFKKMSIDFDVQGLLPGICRMDYLFANLMGNGFERTKTLGDGDDCCNCRYSTIGHCKWSPEEGFIDRK